MGAHHFLPPPLGDPILEQKLQAFGALGGFGLALGVGPLWWGAV